MVVFSETKLLMGGLLLVSFARLFSCEWLDIFSIVSIQKDFCDYETTATVCPKIGQSTESDLFGVDANSGPLDTHVHPPMTPSTSCCGTCSCHTDCVSTDTCCPEIVNKIPKVSTHTICRWPQLRPVGAYYKNSAMRYVMIRGCSFDRDGLQHDESARMMCENAEEYKDMEVYVPVTDIRSNATYLNRYCAFCNGISEQSLVYWKPQINCGNDSPGEVAIDTVVEEVFKTDSCNMIFKAPDSLLSSVTECVDYISSCNVTGEAVYYDPFIAEACGAYNLIYNYKYRNVFCYICNTADIIGKAECSPERHGSDFEDSPIVVTFSALLRFRPREPSDPPETQKPSGCKSNQVYDRFKDVCRNITCFPPRVLQHDSCINPYELISGVAYRFFIKLVSLTALETAELINLPDDIIHYIGNLKTEFSVPSTSQITRVLIKANSANGKDIGQTIPDYYLVQVDIVIPLYKTINPSFIDKILQLDNTTQMVNTKLGYAIGFRASFIMANLKRIDKTHVHDSIQNEILIEIYLVTTDVSIKVSDEPLDTIKSLDKDEERVFENMVNNRDDEFGEQYIEVVIRPKLCPLVTLSSEEFRLKWYHWGVNIDTWGINISRNNYVNIFGAAGNNSIYICKMFFQDIIETLLLRFPKYKNDGLSGAIPQGILSLVCTCLSVVCSVLTLITYVLFSELRTQPGMNNVMLISSLICAQILFQFGIGQVQTVPSWFCETIGVLIHFSWLLTLMWMNVCSIHMFRVFRSLKQISSDASVAKTTLTYTLYSIVMSTIPVVINIVVSKFSDGSMGYGGGLCYITSYKMIGYLFAIPAGLVVVVNLVLFLGVIITISKMPEIDSNASKNRNFAKIYIKISTLTGVTWIFGFLFAFTEIEVLEYVFIILNAGLGVSIFLSFVCNKRVLALYTRIIRPQKLKYSNSTQVSRLSDSPGRSGDVSKS